MTAFDSGTKSFSPIATELVDRSVNAYEPKKIYLFGSHARGEKTCAFLDNWGNRKDPNPGHRGKDTRDIMRIQKQYGPGRWRKLKGFALVRLQSGKVREAELHWYEAHGVGRKKMKIKRFLD